MSTRVPRPWRIALTYLPGVLVFVAIYGLTLARGGGFLYDERFLIMQALDPLALDRYPVAVLASLHTQPPLMNTLYFLTDSVPSALGWVMAAAALVTVVLVTDTVRAAGAGRRWAAVAGAAYALLPATVLYSLFPYSTTVTALFATVTVWGVARSRTWRAYGLAISAVGMVGLFLTRASFAWWVVLGWFVALVLLAWRRRHREGVRAGGPALATALGLGVLSVVLVQGHYTAAFGIPTLSSWSGENVSNALIAVGLSDDAKARLSAADPCFAQLIAAQAWGPVEVYGPCIEPDEPIRGGTPALDLLVRSGPAGGINYNAGARLALADEWNRFARAAVQEEPSAVLRIVTGSAVREGSLARFMGRSDIYFETLEIPKATAPAVWNVLGVWSAVFPWLAWVLVLAAAAMGATVRRIRRGLPTAFWFGLALLVLHGVPSILGDYGENQRFRAELDGVLLATAALGLWVLVTAATSRRGEGAVTPPGSPPSGTSPLPADHR